MSNIRQTMRGNKEIASKQQLSERKMAGNKLIESWSKRKDIVGSKFAESASKNPTKFRALAQMLESFEDHVGALTETQISSGFNDILPVNVMKIIRRGYPNSVRGDVFHEWAMAHENDSIYYWSPVYGSTKRDGVEGTVTHETTTNRYSSTIEQDVIASSVSTTNYTGTLSVIPVRPYKVTILIDGSPVANDNGSGTFSGNISANLGYTATTVTGTINYTTGAYDVTFGTAPTGANFTIESFYDEEVSTNYDEQGSIKFEMERVMFKPDFHSLGALWSLKSEVLLKSSMNIDIENDMLQGASEELKKSLDFRALSLGYNVAKGNPVTNFNADWKTGGSDSQKAHAQSVWNAIQRMGASIYKDLQRGTINRIYGGPDAVIYCQYHDKWQDATGANATGIGAFLAGTINGVPVYQVPSDIVPNDELVGVWNNSEGNDFAISTGVMIPIAATTPKLTYKSLNSESAIYCMEDTKVLVSKYVRRLKLKNLPNE